MNMPPRYSLKQRSRGGRNRADDDELTQMTKAKHKNDFSRHERPSPKSSRGRKDREYEDDESSSESDDESEFSGGSEERSDSEEEEEESVSDYEEEQEEAFDNRSVRSSGGQSIAAQSLARAINKTKNKGGSRLAIQASLAMQRRKKESPELLKKLESKTDDVDYNDGATELYNHIENHRWREVTERCRSEPIETKIWVFRMDKRGKKVLWKMLPIHTAILYRAPVYVILDLISANPEGPKQIDDRKMLPIHMACRVICKEDVLRVLLKHSIETVMATDAKGRTPKDILVEDKRDQDSKVLQKVANRNKKNLLKVLKEYEIIYVRKTSSAPSVAGHRWSRFGDDNSMSSGMVEDDRSVSSRYSRRSVSRPSSKGSTRSARSMSRGKSDRSVSRSDRSVSRSDRPVSRSDRSVSRSDRSVSSGRRERHASTGRAARGIPRPEDGINKRAPRIPTAPSRGVHSRAQSVSRGRGQRNQDDNMSTLSGHSRVSRRLRDVEGYDEDENQSRRSRISKAARGYDDDSVAGSRRSKAISRVVRKPRGAVDAAVGNPMGISEIRVEGEEMANNDASESEEDTSTVSGESKEDIDADLPDGPLYDLWKDVEALYPVPVENFDFKLIEQNEKRLNTKRIAREEAISKMKYYPPPKELQKLLNVIQSGGEISFIAKTKKKGKDARAPLPEKGAQRRVNALGALKALAKNAKNRLRLGRTRGVVSSLLSVLRDEAATAEEKSRCSNTLMFLSVPSQNCEAIFHSDPTILETLLYGMNDNDSRVNYNCCYSLFLLSKSDENRIEIAENADIIKTLVDMSDIEVDDGLDGNDDGDVSVDGSLSQRFANLGSPSGIRQQGAPTTDEETRRGCRLSAMKVFLAISKSKDGAQKMLSDRSLMNLLTMIGGKLTAEENLLCMAIFTNMSRNAENIDNLLRVPNFLEAVTRGLSSRNAECRKCSTLTLQNLSCNRVFRRRIGSIGTSLPGIASQALNINSSGKIAKESHLAAIHTIRNLAVEPSNVPVMMSAPGLTAGLMIAAANRQNELSQYIASDALAAMSQWLDSIVDTCIERNEIDMKGKSLASMRVSTWNPWE